MRLALPLLMVLALLAGSGATEERPQGLLWNRSGLASTLPLQVKTDAGFDYLLHLRDVETGRVVLAAYIRGGEFFRVLAPPGAYEAQFYFGKVWRGEDALFAPETQGFALDQPLIFDASFSRKNGHLIDLRGGGEVVVKDFAFCQRSTLDLESLRYPRDPDAKPSARRDRKAFLLPEFFSPRYETRSRICD